MSKILADGINYFLLSIFIVMCIWIIIDTVFTLLKWKRNAKNKGKRITDFFIVKDINDEIQCLKCSGNMKSDGTMVGGTIGGGTNPNQYVFRCTNCDMVAIVIKKYVDIKSE